MFGWLHSVSPGMPGATKVRLQMDRDELLDCSFQSASLYSRRRYGANLVIRQWGAQKREIDLQIGSDRETAAIVTCLITEPLAAGRQESARALVRSLCIPYKCPLQI